MRKKYDDFSVQEAQRLASTPAGRQLLSLFQQQQGAVYSDAVKDDENANMEKLKQSISAFMQDPKAKALLRQLQEEQHGRNGR